MAMLGLLLFACVFIALGIGDDTTKEYCVVSDHDVAADCPEDCDDCGSLMYYANHSKEYFNQSDTTFRFLGGNHLLENSTLINMGNTSNLILSGETHNSTNFSQPRVVCSESDPGGFSFYNITNLTIEYLSFSQCSGKSLSFHASVALEVQLVHNLMMSGVAIQDTAGFGLMVDSLFGNSHIANTIINSSHNTHDSIQNVFSLLHCNCLSVWWVGSSDISRHRSISRLQMAVWSSRLWPAASVVSGEAEATWSRWHTPSHHTER